MSATIRYCGADQRTLRMRAWRGLLGCLAAGALGLLAAPPAHAAATQPMLEEAEALLKAGKAEAAFQLLEPHEVGSAGDAVYDYLLATAALDSGKPSKATFIYERILAADPGYIGVRADMGRAFFMLGDYARAKIEFETVLAFSTLPPDLRTQVQQYIAAVDARAQSRKTVRTAYLEFGIGRDSNIGSSTSSKVLQLPAYPRIRYRPGPPSGLPTGTEEVDNYATLAVGGEINHLLNERWGLYAGGDYRIRDYARYNDPNNYTLDGRLGASYASGASLLRGGLSAGEYHYYSQRLRETIGLNADWRRAISETNQLTLSGSLVRSTYVPASSAYLSTDTYTGTVGWLSALGDGSTYFNLTGTLGKEKAIDKRDDGDRLFWGPRVLLQTVFNDTLGGYITAGSTRSEYEGANTYYLFARKETLSDLGAALTLTLQKGVSLRPQVSYTRNTSNAELYAYNKTDASLNLRFDY